MASSEGKKIWILNHYASTDFDDKGGRHYCLAKYLKGAGCEPVIFCCNIIHNTNRRCIQNNNLANEQIDESTGVPYVFVKGREYAGNGKKRILNMIDFYRNVKKCASGYADKHGYPEIIYASSVHPLTLVAGMQIAKKFKVKSLLIPEPNISMSLKNI